MNENILIIYNPTSGTKSSEGMISKLIDFYKSNNINYYLLKTEYQNQKLGSFLLSSAIRIE